MKNKQDTLKKEIREEFNKRFKNTSWYPDNWEPIEEFLNHTIDRVREEIKKDVAKNLHKVWMDKFGYEVVMWNKDQGTPISSFQVIEEAIPPLKEEHE